MVLEVLVSPMILDVGIILGRLGELNPNPLTGMIRCSGGVYIGKIEFLNHLFVIVIFPQQGVHRGGCNYICTVYR